MQPVEFQNGVRNLTEHALKRLDQMLSVDDPTIVMSAIREILDRGYGAKAQTKHDPWQETVSKVDIQNLLKD